MEIILARHSGFCEGVERAYKMALDAIAKGDPVYILGDLVHNKDVVKKLVELGVKKVRNLKVVPPRSTLIITAHGTSPEIYEQSRKKGLVVVDTTCPWVLRAQRLSSQLASMGKRVVIVGDKGHPEVVGLMGWAGGGAKVISSKKDLKGLNLKGKLGAIAQTTQSRENFNDVVKSLRSISSDLEIYDTICGATSKRQSSAKELAKKVDLMLVVGDKKSANSKRLMELCRHEGVKTHQIENEGDLKLSWLSDQRRLGITAGASTPVWVIERVVDKIRKHGKKS